MGDDEKGIGPDPGVGNPSTGQQALLLLGFSVLVFLPCLLHGSGFLYGDLLTGYLPQYTRLVESIRQGTEPRIPEMGLGHSLVAAGESPILYLPAVLSFLALGVTAAQPLLLVLHSFWASWWASRLAGEFGIRGAACAFAGVAFGFSGWMFGQVVHPPFQWGASWLPMMLLGIIRCTRAPRSNGPGLLAISTAAILTVGAPQMVVISAATGFIVAIVHWIPARGLGFRVRPVLWTCGSALLGACIALPALLPPLLQIPQSTRSTGLSSRDILAISYSPHQFLTALSPFLWGHPVPGKTIALQPLSFFGAPGCHELPFYGGVATLAFSVSAACSLWKASTTRWLMAGIAICALIAAGRHTPLGELLANSPGMSSFRAFPRFLMPAFLAFALLAAFGLQLWESLAEGKRRPYSVRVVFIGCILLLASGIVLVLGSSITSLSQEWIRSNVLGRPGRLAPDSYYLAWPGAVLSALTTGLLRPGVLLVALGTAGLVFPARRASWAMVAILVMDLGTCFYEQAPPREPPTPPAIASVLQRANISSVFTVPRENIHDLSGWQDLSPDTQSLHGFSSPVIRSNLRARRLAELLGLVEFRKDERGIRRLSAEGHAVLRILGVQAVVFDPAEGPVHVPQGIPVAQVPGATALSISGHRPPAWVVSEVLAASSRASLPLAVLQAAASGRVGFVDPGTPGLPTGPGDGDAAVTIESAGGTAFRIRVSASSDSMLVVRTAFGAGWIARLDGRPSSVYPANGGLVGTTVPGGDHLVTLAYETPGWRPGIYASAATLLLLLAGMGSWRLASKRSCGIRSDSGTEG